MKISYVTFYMTNITSKLVLLIVIVFFILKCLILPFLKKKDNRLYISNINLSKRHLSYHVVFITHHFETRKSFFNKAITQGLL